jgi:hypothetical protein
MSEVKVEIKSLDDLQPDPNNVNKHTVRGHQLVENSLRKRGVGRGILAAGKGVEKPGIVAGNLTHEKARDAGIDEVVFVHTRGNQLVVTVRDDLEPGSPDAVALGIEDNEAAKQSYSPDLDIVAALAAGDNAVLSALKREDDVFSSMLDGMGINQTVRSLDDLESEYGEPSEGDFYPVIRIQVSPETKAKFDELMAVMPFEDEAEKFDALISCVKLP